MSEELPIELAETAQQAARAGGEKLLAMRQGFEVSSKGIGDFVTNADLASQQAVFEVIASRHPTHQLIGEEGESAVPPQGGEICWVVDPLDGTTNYLHQFPFYAVSIAAVRGDDILAGVVYDPLHDKMYWAAAGQGAWRNDQPLKVSSTARFADSLLAMGLPPNPRADSPDMVDFLAMLPRCRAIRRIGSAALNLAYLAAGQLDAYWARQINAWDVAAGVLLVREAGGVVSSSSGGEFDLWKADLASACTQGVHQELLNCLSTSGVRL